MRVKDFLRLITSSSTCLICGVIDDNSLASGLCRECSKTLEKRYLINSPNPVCRICGINLLSEQEICIECRENKSELSNISLFPYRGTAKDIIQFYKFKGYKRLARYFAQMIDYSIKSNGLNDYTVVPVPPDRKKIFEKGWDQIELIMDELTRLGYRRADLLTKKSGKSQKTLTREERLMWIEGRYSLRKKVEIPRSILIIDDVFTTGATISECCRILRLGGAEDIRSLTIARD